MTSGTGRASRLGAIEGLRGLAAVGIVVLHAWILSGKPTDLLPAGVWGPLRMAVPLFFVLSAYFAARPWLRAALDGAEPPAAGPLLRRRFARILPLFWLTGLVALGVLAGTGSSAMPDLPEAVAYALMLHDWVPAGAAGVLNPPTWTLPIELSFALALPLIGWLLVRGGRRGRGGALAVAAGLWLAGIAYDVWFQETGQETVWARTLMLMLPAFAAGIGAAVLTYERRIAPRTAWALQAGGAALFLWYLAGPLGHLQHDLGYRDLIPGIAFAAIIAGMAAHPPPVLGSRPMVWLGGRSFGLYLWHFPVLFLLSERIGWPGQGWATLIALTAGLLLAELSWRLVEQPVADRVR